MKRLMFNFVAVVIGLLFSTSAFAKIHTEIVEYEQDGAILEGYLAYDESIKEKVPGVLIVHDWTGLGSYAKSRAEQVAKLGYVAFAVDIYGKGVRAKDRKEASEQASIYRANRKLMRERINAGLAEIRKYKFVDGAKIAAIGYCFGGGVVLELARGGADVMGVVSFHGNLDTPEPKGSNIKAKVLVLHGADDPGISQEQISAFQVEMRGAKADWQMVYYGNAVHSFTNPGAGSDLASGNAYDLKADTRSWKEMKGFFKEIFEGP